MRLSLGSRLILLLMPLSCVTTQAQSSHEDPPRWEIGGHYTILNIASDRMGCGGCAVISFGRLTHFATDIGGILEYHVTRRISFRTDLGDTIVRHGSQTSTSVIGNTLTTASYYTNNLQWSTGIIFRF